MVAGKVAFLCKCSVIWRPADGVLCTGVSRTCPVVAMVWGLPVVIWRLFYSLDRTCLLSFLCCKQQRTSPMIRCTIDTTFVPIHTESTIRVMSGSRAGKCILASFQRHAGKRRHFCCYFPGIYR